MAKFVRAAKPKGDEVIFINLDTVSKIKKSISDGHMYYDVTFMNGDSRYYKSMEHCDIGLELRIKEGGSR